MASLHPSNKQEVFDPIRSEWVVATPEEKVRQSLVQHLTHRCHFPLSVISIEKKLSELPHLNEARGKIPDRRLDLLCFAPKLTSPLLLIECKAVPLQKKMMAQVLGYNAFVKAPFVALVNEKELKMIWEENGETHTLDFIPSYKDLIKAIRDA